MKEALARLAKMAEDYDSLVLSRAMAQDKVILISHIADAGTDEVRRLVRLAFPARHRPKPEAKRKPTLKGAPVVVAYRRPVTPIETPGGTRYKSLCGDVFKTKKSCSAHAGRCPKCKKIRDGYPVPGVHDKKRFLCSDCGASFDTRQGRNIHHTVVHKKRK